jgi:hypothetical protein
MPRGGKRQNAGRPRGPVKHHVHLLVLPATKKALNFEAFRENKTVGEIIDQIYESTKRIPNRKAGPKSKTP